MTFLPAFAGMKSHPIQNSSSDLLRLSIYERIIFDENGNWRTDQNLIGNFRINQWLRAEAGFRLGERPQTFASYAHYKLELQTKWFYNKVRVLARVSDNMIFSPQPDYKKSNWLSVAEGRYFLTKDFRLTAGAGVVFSAKEFQKTDAIPTTVGIAETNPIYKVGLGFENRGWDVEGNYGSYDVFNPYPIQKPFVQVNVTRRVSPICQLQSYFRYQFNQNIATPENYFFALGAVFNWR
ncbi:MAG: hypothetical protein JST52_08425 [Bacteroidetes bacterium]|nr:hypothetical protein [Bacteroidota bacterium]MBS1740638.1 hypothetical protein [Bacteroidota bacterium]